MIYTAYTEEQYDELPQKYRKEVVGVSYNGDTIQVPICPECGGEMMVIDEYLSCTVCGNIARKRILKE